MTKGIDTKGDSWSIDDVAAMPRVCGIYAVWCVTTNKGYVGSSKTVWGRCKEHIFHLKKNQHYNTKLQRPWNKYKADAFILWLLETCSEEARIERESFWIAKLNTFHNGYNQTPTAEPLKHMSDEHKETLRQITIKRNKEVPQSEEQRRASGERLTKINKEVPQTAERRKKASVRCKAMHVDGRLYQPIVTNEIREARSEKMKEMIEQGVIHTPEQRLASSIRGTELIKAGALNTPTQRSKASEHCKAMNARKRAEKLAKSVE